MRENKGESYNDIAEIVCFKTIPCLLPGIIKRGKGVVIMIFRLFLLLPVSCFTLKATCACIWHFVELILRLSFRFKWADSAQNRNGIRYCVHEHNMFNTSVIITRVVNTTSYLHFSYTYIITRLIVLFDLVCCSEAIN